MTVRERKQMFTQIYNKHCREMWIHEGDCGPDNRAFSYILSREVVLPPGTFENPSEWNIFALLHEIGHIKTNNPKMKVYEKEYHATQWQAIEARKIGFCPSQLWKDTYQEYIWEKRQMCINKKGKNVASKEALIIKW